MNGNGVVAGMGLAGLWIIAAVFGSIGAASMAVPYGPEAAVVTFTFTLILLCLCSITESGRRP